MRKFGVIAAMTVAAILLVSGWSYACGKCANKNSASKASSCQTSVQSCENKAENMSMGVQPAVLVEGTQATVATGTVSNAQAGASCCQAKNATMTNGASCGSKGTSNAVMTSGSSCSMTNASSATCASKASGSCSMTNAGSSCSAKGASMASGSCCMNKSGNMTGVNNKGYYAANVYKVDGDLMYAVADGKKFVVTESTPYNQVGSARYYFADSDCAVKCQEKMASKQADYDREVVSLATIDGNVIEMKDGNKIAKCSVSAEVFTVSDNSPVKVLDGKKVYFCCAGCCEKMTSNSF